MIETEELKKEIIKRYLGEGWEVYLSERSKDRVSVQIVGKGLDFRFLFSWSKRTQALEMVKRLSRIYEEYDIRGIFDLYPGRLL